MTAFKYSYTSASEFPAKLLHHIDLLKHGFRPIHVQWNLTNDCQLHCPYCSCRDRDRELHMRFDIFKEYFYRFLDLGMKAVTITGGGEPLLHPQFDEIVRIFTKARIKVGLVTNGIDMKRWPREVFKDMQWIRISMDKYRQEIPELHENLEYAFSYVYHKDSENDPKLAALVEAVREKKISHLRVVSDIHCSDERFEIDGVLDKAPPKVFVQNRREYTKGARNCWIALVKPVVDVDGLLYPCCGAQYALKTDHRGFPAIMCMGNIDVYKRESIATQTPFNGLICRKCYYSRYNEALDAIKYMNNLHHKDHI